MLSPKSTFKNYGKEIKVLDPVLAALKKQEQEVDSIVSQLEVLYKMVGSYEALVNKRAQLFKKLTLKDVKLNEQKYKSLLLEHYTFLKRPVLLYDGHIFVGNSSKTISAAKSFLNEQ